MTQKISPFVEGKYGWSYGESGWNLGMDENLLKFSFLFDRNVDGIVSSLPPAVSGAAYFLTADNRIYFAVNNTWYSTSTPKWFLLTIKATGLLYQYNGTSIEPVASNSQLDTRLDSVEVTVSGLGSAALRPEAYFASATQLSTAITATNSYTDAGLATKLNTANLTNSSDITKGAALVGYRNRTLLSRLDDRINLTDFGADPTGVNDSSPAMLAALAFSTNIYIPKGKFKFLSKITYTFSPASSGPSDNKNNYGCINIEGAGQDGTILYFPSTDGFEFVCQSFQQTVHIKNLSITTGRVNGGTAIGLRNRFAFFGSYTAQHDLDNVTIRGDDGYGAVFYWTRCVYLFNITAFNCDACSIYGPLLGSTANTYGTGFYVESSFTPGIATSTEPGCGTSYNFTRLNAVFLGRAFHIGTLVQAFKIGTGCAILNGYDGVYVPAGGLDVRQVTLSGVEISVNGNAVEFQTACSGTLITGCYIAVSNGKNGIVLATDAGAMNSGGTCITGNTFVPFGASSSDGIYINTTYAPISIYGNTFLGMTRGIELTSASRQVTVGGNKYMNCTQNILNAAEYFNTIGLDEDIAWTAFTSIPTPSTGSFTSANVTGTYRKVGKMFFYNVTLTITTNGTAAGNTTIPFPNGIVIKSTRTCHGRENAITGFVAGAVVTTSGITFTKYDGTYLGGNGYVINFTGESEIN